MLKFIGMFLQLRIERYFQMKDARNKLKDRENTVDMISRFLKQKTYKALMMTI